MDITTTNGWSIIADCSVVYDGRAYSILDRGRYLIIYKSDNSISIHGSDFISPRNYLSNAKLISSSNGVFVFVCKKEKIIITIYKIESIMSLGQLSDFKPKMQRTEQELVDKIFNNWNLYIKDSKVIEIHKEYQTELGPIDLFGVADKTSYIIEVKRRSITVNDVRQLMKYIEAIQNRDCVVIGYVAGPKISKNADKYLKTHQLNFIEVDF